MAAAYSVDRSELVRGPWNARLALAIFLAATAFFVSVTFSPLKSGFADAPDRGPSDVALYRAEVQRMQGGDGYYDAAEAELGLRGYPTRSLFNWRMPLPMWLIARVPDAFLAKALLALLCFGVGVLSFQLLAEEGSLGEALLGVGLLIGALMPCVLADLMVMSELWSGVLVALSAACFGLERRTAGVATGVAALFFRELAAPYVLVCLALAAHERRGRELGLWAIGLAAYAVFFAAHVSSVLPRIAAEDAVHADGWIRFGGAGFLISTVQMNAFLLLLPQWVTAVYLSFVLLGCWAWRTGAGTRLGLTVAAYAIAFGIAGNDFNQYWGSMIAPICCLPASRGPATLLRLLRAAWPAPFRAAGECR